MDDVQSAFDRHQKAGFQFSGGRDSTAALYVLKPYWDRMTVYWLDTGDTFPETREVVKRVAQDVPVATIRANVRSSWQTIGWPSDVVPFAGTALGRAVDGGDLRVVGRDECCWRNLMMPMHQRMLDDGITLIVRGQRDEDYANPVTRSGTTDGSMEVLYPIQSWSTEDVERYIADNRLPKASYYAEGLRHGSDCMRCTAWWDDGRLPWLRRTHPKAFAEVERRLHLINSAVGAHLTTLHKELTHE